MVDVCDFCRYVHVLVLGGFIEEEELGTIMSDLGVKLTKAELTDIVMGADTNFDGKIDEEEFLAISCLRCVPANTARSMRRSHNTHARSLMCRVATCRITETDIKEAFEAIDTDHSGAISSTEFR